MLQNLRTTSEGDEVIAVYQPTVDDFIKVNFESLDVLSQRHLSMSDASLVHEETRYPPLTPPPLQPTVPSPPPYP